MTATSAFRGLVLLVLLASLAVNLALIQKWRSRPEPAIQRPASVAAAIPPAANPEIAAKNLAGATTTQNGATIAPDPRLSDYRYVTQRMKAEGFSWGVTNYVVIAIHSGKADGGVSGDFNREFKEAFGVSPVLLANQQMWDGLTFGDLESQKIAAVKLLKEAAAAEYRAIPAAERGSITEESLLAGKLREVLTPAEFDDYFRFNSRLAQAVQRSIAAVATTEDEYDRLLHSAALRESETPGTGDPIRSPGAQKIAVLREYEEVLGLDRFLAVSRSFSSNFATIDDVYAGAEIARAKRVELLYRTLDVESPSNSNPASVLSIYHDLTTGAGLNAAQIAAFDETSFGKLLKQRSDPRRPL